MNEGIFFLWLCWLLWTYATFLMKKTHSLRVFIASSSLIAIILSNKFVEMYELNVNVSLIYLVSIGIWLMKESSIKEIIYCFLTVVLYSSIKIYYLVDPILFFYQEKLFLVVGSTALLLLFFNGWKNRIGSLFLMIGLGEFIFTMIIKNFLEETYSLGLEVLDMYSAVFLCVSVVYLYGIFIAESKKLVMKKKKTVKNSGL